jgi:hypothetical protein
MRTGSGGLELGDIIVAVGDLPIRGSGDLMLALEVDGGTFSGGGHVRGAGVAKDCEKACEAAIRGWRVLRVDGDQVRDGRALEWARRALVGVAPQEAGHA